MKSAEVENLGRIGIIAESRSCKHRLESLLEAMSEGFFESDLQGNLIVYNNAFSNMFGYRKEELKGVNYRMFMAPRSAGKMNALFRQVDKSGLPAQCKKHEIILENGGKRYVEISIEPIISECGGSIGYRGLVRDVTDRVRLDREKRKLEQQLRQAQKMEAIGTLAGGIAHDFNNILHAISSYSQILQYRIGDGSWKLGQLSAIENLARKGSDLVKRLMVFSRKVESELRPVDLNQEIRNMIELLERTMPNISIRTDWGEPLLPIMADSVQMEQILMNLGVNARDAMPGGGTLRISTGNEVLEKDYIWAKPGLYVRLSVSDSGHGMTPEVADRIFEPFFTTKSSERGTGLGLAVVYGIVKGHHGYIACDSRLGRGTTFNLYFPAIKQREIGPEEPVVHCRMPGKNDGRARMLDFCRAHPS